MLHAAAAAASASTVRRALVLPHTLHGSRRTPPAASARGRRPACSSASSWKPVPKWLPQNLRPVTAAASSTGALACVPSAALSNTGCWARPQAVDHVSFRGSLPGLSDRERRRAFVVPLRLVHIVGLRKDRRSRTRRCCRDGSSSLSALSLRHRCRFGAQHCVVRSVLERRERLPVPRVMHRGATTASDRRGWRWYAVVAMFSRHVRVDDRHAVRVTQDRHEPPIRSAPCRRRLPSAA